MRVEGLGVRVSGLGFRVSALFGALPIFMLERCVVAHWLGRCADRGSVNVDEAICMLRSIFPIQLYYIQPAPGRMAVNHPTLFLLGFRASPFIPTLSAWIVAFGHDRNRQATGSRQ